MVHTCVRKVILNQGDLVFWCFKHSCGGETEVYKHSGAAIAHTGDGVISEGVFGCNSSANTPQVRSSPAQRWSVSRTSALWCHWHSLSNCRQIDVRDCLLWKRGGGFMYRGMSKVVKGCLHYSYFSWWQCPQIVLKKGLKLTKYRINICVKLSCV